MNSIDTTGLKRKKTDNPGAKNFQDKVAKEMGSSFPGYESVRIYSTGPRVSN